MLKQKPVSQIPSSDFDAARAEVEALLKVKFGTQDDGSQRVACVLVDRARCQPLFFRPLPYAHVALSKADKNVLFETALLNLQLAHDQLQVVMKLRRSDRLAKVSK